jgi:serine/threonine protein kinase
MNPKLVQLFRDALDLEGLEREAFLAQHCADAVERAQIDALLKAALETAPMLPDFMHDQLSRIDRDVVDRTGEMVGPFRLLQSIGSGGMGSVWLAERAEGFAQQVAIKWAHRSGLSSAMLARFALERELLAKLDHPAIARIIDGGADQGALWFAMEYVDGLPLDRYVEAHQPDLTTRITLVSKLCSAVHYAHQNLIVHRDLKPSNVLVQADGSPKLLDFGIAKRLDGIEALTRSQAPMTFAYAAPEQIKGDTITTTTDVYALGVILYELLTGERPHKAKAAESGGLSLLQAITDTDATAPSLVINRATQMQSRVNSAQLKGDLDIIVLKALNRDPARRYPSAQALADDLARYLDGLPISARKDSARYRLVKFVRRNKLATAAAMVAVAALISATIVSTLQTQRANEKVAHTHAQNQRYISIVVHVATVLNRVRSAGLSVSTEQLFDWVADPTLEDAAANASLKIGIAGILRSTSDSRRMLKLYDSIGPELTGMPTSDQGGVHADRASALIRLGRFAEAKIALDAYAKLKLAPSIDDAWVQDLLSQIHHKQGNTEAAMVATLESVRIARSLPDVDPKQMGGILTNAAISMLGAAQLANAKNFGQEALAVYDLIGMTLKSELNVPNSVLAKVAFARGNLLNAQSQFAAFEQNDPGEVPTTKVLRHAMQARALALLAQPQQATTLIQAARAEICNLESTSSPYCARLTIALADVATINQQHEVASEALKSIDATSLSGIIVNQFAQSRLRLNLLAAPSVAAVQAYKSWVQTTPETGLALLNTRRSLLISAQQLWLNNQPELATQLAQTALELSKNLPKDSGVEGGMDESLLTIWQARIEGTATTPAMRTQLALAMGENHPWVMQLASL